MEKKKNDEAFDRDGDGNLKCDGLVGQDVRACNEMKKKEMVDDLPRDASGKLLCENLNGEEKGICVREKAGEAARKSIGIKTDGDL